MCCLQRVRRSGRARRAVTFANDFDSEPEDIDVSDSGWSGDDKELKPTRRSSLGRLIRNPRVRIVQGGQGAQHAAAVTFLLQSPESPTLHTWRGFLQAPACSLVQLSRPMPFAIFLAAPDMPGATIAG